MENEDPFDLDPVVEAGSFEYVVQSQRPSKKLHVYFVDCENVVHKLNVGFGVSASFTYEIGARISQLDDNPEFAPSKFVWRVDILYESSSGSESVMPDNEEWEQNLLTEAHAKGFDVIRAKSIRGLNDALIAHKRRYKSYVEERLKDMIASREQDIGQFENGVNGVD